MSTPAIKTKFELDGEKEYKAALTNINSGLRVLNSEMKLTSAQFGENADGVESLTQKNDVLNRQLLTQKEKVDTLKAALQQSAQKYGEADTKTNTWKVSLNNAEKELIDLEKEIKDNNTALDKHKTATETSKGGLDKFGNSVDTSGDKTKGLGTILDGLASKFGVNLPEGVTSSFDSFVKLDGKTAVLAAGFAIAATAIFSVEKALASLTLGQANVAGEIENLSQVVGFSTSAYQEWDYVLKQVGWSMEQAQGDISQLAEKAMDAAKGDGEAAELFNKMGVSVLDVSGKLKSQEVIFGEVIIALRGMTDETERNAISSALMSTTGERLVPVFNKTANEIDLMKQRAHELGYVMSEELLTSLGDVKESSLDYQASLEGAKNKIAGEFAPALEKFYTIAAKGIIKFGDFAKKSGLVEFFASILELVSSLGPAFELFGTMITPFIIILKPLAVVLGVIADALSIILNLVGAVGGIFDGTSGDYIDAIGGILTGSDSATGRAWNGAFNASGTDDWRGGMTWVGENGPEKVYLPQGSQIQSAQESRMNGGNVYNITIDAKNVQEFNDIVRIAKNERITGRMGYAGG